MPFLTPVELINSEPGCALDIFLKSSLEDLQSALPALEEIRGGDKRLYIFPLIINADYTQLLALAEKSKSLNSEPAARSFLFRLNDAIALQQMVLEFDSENYNQLNKFIKFDGDKLREFADIIIQMQQSTADLLIGVILKTNPQSVSGLNIKLRTTLDVDVDIKEVPIFNSLNNAIKILDSDRGFGLRGGSSRFLAAPQNRGELDLDSKEDKPDSTNTKAL